MPPMPDRVVVAAGQQGRACRRAERRRVEAGVLRTASAAMRVERRASRTARRRRWTAPNPTSSMRTIRTFGAPSGGRSGWIGGNVDVGVLGVVQDGAGVGPIRDRQDGPRVVVGSLGHSVRSSLGERSGRVVWWSVDQELRTATPPGCCGSGSSNLKRRAAMRNGNPNAKAIRVAGQIVEASPASATR